MNPTGNPWMASGGQGKPAKSQDGDIVGKGGAGCKEKKGLENVKERMGKEGGGVESEGCVDIID